MTQLYGNLQLVPPATPRLVRVSWWRHAADAMLRLGDELGAMRMYCRAAIVALGLSGSHGTCPEPADSFEEIPS